MKQMNIKSVSVQRKGNLNYEYDNYKIQRLVFENSF